jgi:hypothetical protein
MKLTYTHYPYVLDEKRTAVFLAILEKYPYLDSKDVGAFFGKDWYL